MLSMVAHSSVSFLQLPCICQLAKLPSLLLLLLLLLLMLLLLLSIGVLRRTWACLSC